MRRLFRSGIYNNTLAERPFPRQSVNIDQPSSNNISSEKMRVKSTSHDATLWGLIGRTCFVHFSSGERKYLTREPGVPRDLVSMGGKNPRVQITLTGSRNFRQGEERQEHVDATRRVRNRPSSRVNNGRSSGVSLFLTPWR